MSESSEEKLSVSEETLELREYVGEREPPNFPPSKAVKACSSGACGPTCRCFVSRLYSSYLDACSEPLRFSALLSSVAFF